MRSCFVHSREDREIEGLPADDAGSWDNFHERFEVKTINQKAHGLYGACTHIVERYFGGPRRAEIGIHQHSARTVLLRDVQEGSWPEEIRRVSHVDHVNRLNVGAVTDWIGNEEERAYAPLHHLAQTLFWPAIVKNGVSSRISTSPWEISRSTWA